MSYIGNNPTQQAFTPAVDYFNGTGSATAFTLSRPVASVAQVQVTIENVPQNPSSAFTVSGSTITFTSAPPSGTSNIYVQYTSPITQVIAPGQGTVTATSMASSTGTGAGVFATSPTLTTPTISSLSSASATALTLQSGGTTAVTIDTSQNVGIGTSSPNGKLDVRAPNVVTDAISQVSVYANDFGINYGGSIGLGGAYNTALTTFTDYTQIAGRKENSTSGDYAGYLSFATRVNGGGITERMRIDSSGNVLVTNPAGLGYGTGSGGTVTQATSKSTAVTLNKPTGKITMSNAALANGTSVDFTLNNSLIGVNDVVVVSQSYSSLYEVLGVQVSAGALLIRVKNVYTISLSEPLTINFTVLKGATA
jgi:hypothetical protein